MLKANEVKITITVAKRSFNKIIFGPLLSAEVVKTISIPTMKKATDAQINTFVAIFCPDIVLIYQLKHFLQIVSVVLKIKRGRTQISPHTPLYLTLRLCYHLELGWVVKSHRLIRVPYFVAETVRIVMANDLSKNTPPATLPSLFRPLLPHAQVGFRCAHQSPVIEWRPIFRLRQLLYDGRVQDLEAPST